jgi:hypothetical protein
MSGASIPRQKPEAKVFNTSASSGSRTTSTPGTSRRSASTPKILRRPHGDQASKEVSSPMSMMPSPNYFDVLTEMEKEVVPQPATDMRSEPAPVVPIRPPTTCRRGRDPNGKTPKSRQQQEQEALAQELNQALILSLEIDEAGLPTKATRGTHQRVRVSETDKISISTA